MSDPPLTAVSSGSARAEGAVSSWRVIHPTPVPRWHLPAVVAGALFLFGWGVLGWVGVVCVLAGRGG